MTITQLEKEMIKALTINSKIDWSNNEISPNEEFKNLIKFLQELVNEYKGE
jgi:hypothetical protein